VCAWVCCRSHDLEVCACCKPMIVRAYINVRRRNFVLMGPGCPVISQRIYYDAGAVVVVLGANVGALVVVLGAVLGANVGALVVVLGAVLCVGPPVGTAVGTAVGELVFVDGAKVCVDAQCSVLPWCSGASASHKRPVILLRLSGRLRPENTSSKDWTPGEDALDGEVVHRGAFVTGDGVVKKSTTGRLSPI